MQQLQQQAVSQGGSAPLAAQHVPGLAAAAHVAAVAMKGEDCPCSPRPWQCEAELQPQPSSSGMQQADPEAQQRWGLRV